MGAITIRGCETWNIDLGDGGPLVPVKFCPFCGEQLGNKPPKFQFPAGAWTQEMMDDCTVDVRKFISDQVERCAICTVRDGEITQQFDAPIKVMTSEPLEVIIECTAADETFEQVKRLFDV